MNVMVGSRREWTTWKVALALWCILPAANASATTLTIDEYAAENQKPAVFVAPRDASLGTLFVRFHVGAFDDDQEYGRTRLTQRVLIDANKVLGQDFLESLYAAHATLQLRTGPRTCAFVLTAPRTALNPLARRLLKGLFSPRIDDRKLDRARRLTLDDQSLQSGLSHLISLTAGEILLSEVSPRGGDYRNPAYGDRASVVALKRRDVLQHIDRYFAPANASIAAVGPVDDKLIAALKRLRGGRRHDVRRGDTTSLPRTLERRSRQEMHLHAQVLDLTSPKEVAAARVLEALVHDRIMWRLRSKGVTYSPYVAAQPFDWLDLLVIFVPVSRSRERGVRVEPLLREYLDQILIQVKDEEFMAGRDDVISQMSQIDQQPVALAEAIMRRNRRVPWHHDDVLAATRALTQQEFQQTIRQWLSPERSINILFGRSRAEYKKRGP